MIVNVDFEKNVGKLKKVNGVSNGPVCHGVDLTKYFNEANVSCVRYHDTDGSGAFGRCMIDISRIFENFDADEFDANNYRFEHTDKLLLSATSNGAEVIYRLGESIDHTIYKRYAHPPKDFDKWVRICLQIIKHYNDGWDNGFHLNLKYWEIWNEPEGHATDGTQPMWSGGTFEQMLELYKKASLAIKEYNPNLKVGGLSFMYVDFAVEPFLQYCQKEKLPLDFLSFHHYAQDTNWIVSQAKDARNWLDKYGYINTEIIIGEWALLLIENFSGDYWKFIADPINETQLNKQLFTNQKNELGASFITAFLIALNDTPVDMAILYDFDPKSNWCALFNNFLEPQKSYYAFKNYGDVLKNSMNRCFAESDKGKVIASKAKDHLDVIISTQTVYDEKITINLNNIGKYKNVKVYCINKDLTDEIVYQGDNSNKIELPIDNHTTLHVIIV